MSYESATFSIQEERCERMARFVLSHAKQDVNIRILDLGCGTGGQILRLAEDLPMATFVGLDISKNSIDIATKRAEASPYAGRIECVAAPYLGPQLGEFDMIISDTVLHLIAGEDDEIISKLARELKPGGKLLYTMPYRCAFNEMLLAVRRSARLIRTPGFDSVLLKIASALHGKQYSTAFIRERIAYMYIVPHRFHGAQMIEGLDRHGLSLVSERVLPNESMAKLKHKSAVYLKRATSSPA